jgi:dTDP-4-amino-4,6-dideoxygalactose transaminase
VRKSGEVTNLATHREGAADASQSLELSSDERWPFHDEDEIAAVTQVLRSSRVNQWTGPEVIAFEQACAERFGGGRGIALANGSVALELALRAFGVGPGDEVIVSPRSFVASASCAMLVGATPVFADVDPASGNITAETVANVLTERTRAIIPVHLAGWPADVPAMMELVRGRNAKVIEDCAQAHGAEIYGTSVGAFGDAAAFSFCQDKIISTGGEGGLLTIKDDAAWEWAWSFKDHGKDYARSTTPNRDAGSFRWVHDRVGTNWRLTGPQAALGLVQLEKLDGWRAVRTRNAQIWSAALARVSGLRVPLPASNSLRHAFYKLNRASLRNPAAFGGCGSARIFRRLLRNLPRKGVCRSGGFRLPRFALAWRQEPHGRGPSDLEAGPARASRQSPLRDRNGRSGKGLASDVPFLDQVPSRAQPLEEAFDPRPL